jgi:microcystin-dependent protein
MSEPFLGQITLYPYTFPPSGWMDCAGQLLPISQYAALFSLIGTYYGGNGTSNFALPNLQGMVTVGQGQLSGGSDYAMGESGGSDSVTLLYSTMGAHTHSLGGTNVRGTLSAPVGAVFAAAVKGTATSGQDKGLLYSAPPTTTTLTPASIVPVGGNQPHNNIQPSLGLRYCIAMTGVFPARS